MTAHAVDVTTTTFEAEVVEASKSTPVVVDFWAPWCGPCVALKPILEKLATEYGGKFKLVKVNSDDNQELANAFGVRSIPFVLGFSGGEPVSHFLGAVPESQVRAFIDKLIPTPSELERMRASELRQSGNAVDAQAALQKAVTLDPANDLAHLDLAELLIELKQADEAEAALSAVRPNIDWDERVANLRAALAFVRSASSGVGETELRARLALNPDDHESRYALAGHRAGTGHYREALDQLLGIILRDKNWNKGEARKQIVAIFGLAVNQPDLVSEYRKKLASALN